MNNPPDISQDPKEYEEYAHGVQKHVRGYLMVGALCSRSPCITVALSYVDFGTGKANIAIAMLVATFKAVAVAAVFMHLAAEKRLIYRILIFTGFFVLGLFWLILSGVVRLSDLSLNVLKGFHIVFIVFSTLLALGVGRGASGLIWWRARRFILQARSHLLSTAVALIIYGVWFYRKMKRLRHHHMKTNFLSTLLLFIFSPVGQALACPFCYGAKDGKSTEQWRLRSGFFSAP